MKLYSANFKELQWVVQHLHCNMLNGRYSLRRFKDNFFIYYLLYLTYVPALQLELLTHNIIHMYKSCSLCVKLWIVLCADNFYHKKQCALWYSDVKVRLYCYIIKWIYKCLWNTCHNNKLSTNMPSISCPG